jgi:hypothetical protein
MDKFRMKLKYRPFQCDNCGTIHSIQTNHEGQVYAQKCKNWPCTPGFHHYVSMTFFPGTAENIEATFYTKDIHTKARLDVNLVKYNAWLDAGEPTAR